MICPSMQFISLLRTAIELLSIRTTKNEWKSAASSVSYSEMYVQTIEVEDWELTSWIIFDQRK